MDAPVLPPRASTSIGAGLPLLAVVLAAVAAGAFVWATCAGGIRLTPDSLKYLLLARSLSQQRGFTIAGEPVSHFPPGYPALLAATGISGPEDLEGGRRLQGVIFALSVLAAAALVRAAAGGAAVPAVVTAWLLAGSSPLVAAHAAVWSEGLFILLLLVAFNLLVRDARSARVVGAVFLGAALLTRYAGLAFVPSAAVAGLLAAAPDRRTRLRGGAELAAIALLPALAWMARNALVSASAANRSLSWHPLEAAQLRALGESLSLLWGRVGPFGPALTAAALGGGLVFGRRLRGGTGIAAPMMAAGGVAYLGLLAVSLTSLDADTPLDTRLLSPLFVVSAVLLSLSAEALSAAARRAARVALVLLALVNLWGTVDEARGLCDDGGFNHPYWTASPTLENVRSLPPGTRLRSNGPEIVAFLTGRDVLDVPGRWSRTSLREDPRFEGRLVALCAELGQPGHILVHLDGVGWRWELPAIEDIEVACGIGPWARFADGRVYGDGSLPIYID